MPDTRRLLTSPGSEQVAEDDHGQQIEDLARAAAIATHELESRMAVLALEAEHVKQRLDESRSKVQREREEMDIEYSLDIGSTFVVEAPGSEELRRVERELTQRTIRAAGLQRQLAEFSSIVATTARQLDTGGELPGVDAATEAAIRSAAVEAQERERHRLAREIHDGPAQALANAIIALEFVERAIRSDGAVGRALDEVERIKATLREGLTEIRRFIFDLRPTMLQDRGLVSTIEHYIATYETLFPMAIEIQAHTSIPRLTNDQELTAFRVVQEAIQNARKHARATRVVVSITQVDDALRVTVQDNGRGFSPDRVTTHVMSGAGLRGMRERAALVAADIEIESEPGAGATISLSIPILSHAAGEADEAGEQAVVEKTEHQAPKRRWLG